MQLIHQQEEQYYNMSKLFICDKCGKQFNSPLDEEHFTDEHGVNYTFDMCAPCRKDLREERDNTHKEFFGKLIKHG